MVPPVPIQTLELSHLGQGSTEMGDHLETPDAAGTCYNVDTT